MFGFIKNLFVDNSELVQSEQQTEQNETELAELLDQALEQLNEPELAATCFLLDYMPGTQYISVHEAAKSLYEPGSIEFQTFVFTFNRVVEVVKTDTDCKIIVDIGYRTEQDRARRKEEENELHRKLTEIREEIKRQRKRGY